MALSKEMTILAILLLNIFGIRNGNAEALQQDFDNFADYFDVQDEYISVTPCDTLRAGDPDLKTYDIISAYHFDEYNHQYQGVQKIVGSTNYQTAYHIEEYTNTTISSTQAFPKGLPDEFSFECTFRRSEEDPQIEWYLFELTDYSYESQMSVTINEAYNSLQFSLPKYDGSIQTVSFEEVEIFDRSWHKVMLGVTQDAVRLWIDCQPIPDRSGTLLVPLQVRGPIDLTQGAFSVARNCKSRSTVPIDLQWMIFSCDSQKPLETGCSDIPARPIYPIYPQVVSTTPRPEPDTSLPPFDLSFLTTSTQIPWILSTTPSALQGTESHACPVQCPMGPPGPPGPAGKPGMPGPVGPQGTPGIQNANYEVTTIKGQKGEPGLDGLHGLDGAKGERGADGAVGLEGLKGDVGEKGASGAQGIQGPPGPPGLPGYSGQQEVTSRVVEEREIREICLAVVRDYITEISTTLVGPPGPPGRHGIGRPGPAGPQGLRGDQGPPGQAGERGYPGIGFPGPQGEMGPRGPEGQKGDRGDDGVGMMGPMGPQGPPGNDGRGLEGMPGRPGDRGEPGRPGQSGSQGPAGPAGVCPDCSAYQAAYTYPLYLAQQQQSNKGPQYYYNKGPPNYYNKAGGAGGHGGYGPGPVQGHGGYGHGSVGGHGGYGEHGGVGGHGVYEPGPVQGHDHGSVGGHGHGIPIGGGEGFGGY